MLTNQPSAPMRSTLMGTPTSYQTTGTGTSVKSNILYKTKQVLVRRMNEKDVEKIKILLVCGFLWGYFLDIFLQKCYNYT